MTIQNFIKCFLVAQSGGTVEYTDCISAEVKDSPIECLGYDTKQSEDKDSDLEI